MVTQTHLRKLVLDLEATLSWLETYGNRFPTAKPAKAMFRYFQEKGHERWDMADIFALEASLNLFTERRKDYEGDGR